VLKGGPHEANAEGLVVKPILVGLLTVVLRVIGPLTLGAHLNESPVLPELLVPPPPENVMLRGFVDQRAFGVPAEAKPTAA
jgi:hypothetical protein